MIVLKSKARPDRSMLPGKEPSLAFKTIWVQGHCNCAIGQHLLETLDCAKSFVVLCLKYLGDLSLIPICLFRVCQH